MGKHYDVRKKKVNKKKIFLIIAIPIAIIALILFNNRINNDKKEIVDIINSTFSSLKENNKEKINKYIDYNLLITGLDDMILEENKDEIEKELFNKISWNVENVEIKGNSAIAIIEASNKDYREILTKWMKAVIDEKNKGQNISNELGLNKLKTIVKEETLIKTIIKKINFENTDGKWNIILDNNFIELVYPGIDNVTKALNFN